jgi:cytochrome c
MIARTTLTRLFASAALMTFVAACGGSDKPAETAEAPAAETAAAPAEETAAAVAPVEAPVAPAAAPEEAEVTLASLTGDAAKGEKVFAQCKACHVAEEGVNRVGPSLWGVVGRTAGSIEGFRYSSANKNSGLVWSEEQLFTYLKAPRETIPGTTMAFAGLKKPQDRADVIAYLKTRS